MYVPEGLILRPDQKMDLYEVRILFWSQDNSFGIPELAICRPRRTELEIFCLQRYPGHGGVQGKLVYPHHFILTRRMWHECPPHPKWGDTWRVVNPKEHCTIILPKKKEVTGLASFGDKKKKNNG